MTVTIPVWLLWMLGIVGGAILLIVVGAILMFALMEFECARAIGKGLNW